MFICNERCYADVQTVLAEHLMNFKVTDASVYSQESNGKIKVGAEYQGYNFLGKIWVALLWRNPYQQSI